MPSRTKQPSYRLRTGTQRQSLVIMLSTQFTSQNNIPPPSSLQAALQMDPNQHLQLQKQHEQEQQQPILPTQNSAKKRRKEDGNGDDAPSPSERRRLRRSHEACTRCRSKKIKCDSKLPRCTACTTAGTACHQEDRHSRTLTPRGHTEHLEHQLAQCSALIKKQIPGFKLENLPDVLRQEGIDAAAIIPGDPSPAFQMESMRPSRNDVGPMYPPPGPHMMPSPLPPHGIMYGPSPYVSMQPPPGPYQSHIPPPFPTGVTSYPLPAMHPPPPERGPPVSQSPTPMSPPIMLTVPVPKGTDPNGNDMSSARALANSFGVSPAITSELKLDGTADDITLEPAALSKIGALSARDASQWITMSIHANAPSAGVSNSLSVYGPASRPPTVDVWLPKNRNMAQHILEIYFTRLNLHRPVFSRKDFENILNDLYEGITEFYDPGNVLSIYMVFALGTLSELNHRGAKADLDSNKSETMQHLGAEVTKKLMPLDWPAHDEFFERALAVKPSLCVSISSLQALILLHWYLYIGCQGRSLWGLVGSQIRLAIELGFHHDPTTQFSRETNQPIFTEEESQLRIRLWAIIIILDRGISILLGRPLAISASDSNTPHPSRPKNARFAEFSEHFELSLPIANFQADIVNSLYAPTRHAGDTIMRNATRIIKSMAEFRRRLPERYKYYFDGTDQWSLDKRTQLVQDISEGEGLTLLKIGIARILMLRALFSSKELSFPQKHKALVDAIIASHNVIIVHSQLIRFPDIAFFTSPIPLHISAMVILYGHISRVECLPGRIALEDIWLALDMLPRFRWRWERKDVSGGHPLIAKLVEHIMGTSLHTMTPTVIPILLSEPEWDEQMSPVPNSQHGTPVMSSMPSTYTPTTTTYSPHQRPLNDVSGALNRSNNGSTPPGQHLAYVPTTLFYPFFPEAQVNAITMAPTTGSNTSGTTASGSEQAQDYRELLGLAAAAQEALGGRSFHESYTSEERDVWPASRNITGYSAPSQP